MNLKIFKLRSGEEVIGQIIDEFKTKFIVSNPFVFRTSTMADHNGTYDTVSYTHLTLPTID
jgi:hypothetical protein